MKIPTLTATVFMEIQGIFQTKIYVCFLIMFLANCQNFNIEYFIKNEIKTELRNGVLFLNNKPFKGILLSYHENGIKKSEIRYENGMKNGTEKNWYTNGNLKMDRSYLNGIKIGIHKGWWKNKKLKYRYEFDNKGRYDGNVEEWYENGQKLKKFNFTMGRENGKQMLWDLNGNVKANYEVINGERYGLIGLKKCFTVAQNN